GVDLDFQHFAQTLRFGARIKTNQAVTSIKRQADGVFLVETNKGENAFRSRAIILAPGSDYRRLGIPGETELRQQGKVSYCATCDGAFYRGKEVLCVGGGNTSVEDTLYLASHFTSKTTLIHRRTEFRAQKILVEELYEKAAEYNIDVKLPYVPLEIVATADGTAIDHVKIQNVATKAVEQIRVDGVFVFVGMVPNTDWLRDIVDVDELGYLPADPATMKTAVPGIWIAGDCRQSAAMQLATAAADGVVAAMGLRAFFRDPTSW
ncbi:MAG TPA: FAD-dependent oxidoreductase, partial [Phycisphaerae bacterium]|nr:FAD-dependent oxidoreductase [Phycisphaerae bacterium]